MPTLYPPISVSFKRGMREDNFVPRVLSYSSHGSDGPRNEVGARNNGKMGEKVQKD